jgi:hypothetical protein
MNATYRVALNKSAYKRLNLVHFINSTVAHLLSLPGLGEFLSSLGVRRFDIRRTS